MIFGSTEYREWLVGLRFAERVVVRDRWQASSSNPPGPPQIVEVQGTTGSKIWAGADIGRRAAPGYSRTTGYRLSTAGVWPRPRLEPLTPELQAEAADHVAKLTAEEAERKRAWDLHQVDGDIGRVEREIAHLREQLAGAEQQLADLRSKRAALEGDHD